jgi:hypothetical protein
MLTQMNSVSTGSNSADMEWYQKRVEELSIITDELKMPLNALKLLYNALLELDQSTMDTEDAKRIQFAIAQARLVLNRLTQANGPLFSRHFPWIPLPVQSSIIDPDTFHVGDFMSGIVSPLTVGEMKTRLSVKIHPDTRMMRKGNSRALANIVGYCIQTVLIHSPSYVNLSINDSADHSMLQVEIESDPAPSSAASISDNIGIAKKLVQSVGGSFSYVSGRVSALSFTLPLPTPLEQPPLPSPSTALGVPPAPSHPEDGPPMKRHKLEHLAQNPAAVDRMEENPSWDGGGFQIDEQLSDWLDPL